MILPQCVKCDTERGSLLNKVAILFTLTQVLFDFEIIHILEIIGIIGIVSQLHILIKVRRK